MNELSPDLKKQFLKILSNLAPEQPLVTWPVIAGHLNISEDLTRRIFAEYEIPVMRIGKMVAIYPSRLREELEKHEEIVI